MPTCAVVGCLSGSGRETKSYPQLSFPECEECRQKWLEIVNRNYMHTVRKKPHILKPSSHICIKHFRKDDFIPKNQNKDGFGRIRKKKCLKPHRIPSQFLTLDTLSGDVSDDSESDVEESLENDSSNLSTTVNNLNNISKDASEKKPRNKPRKQNLKIVLDESFHEGKKANPCDMCEASFESEHYLWIHINKVHDGKNESLDDSSNMPTIVNPWSVSDASVFLKYCCPECEFTDQNLSEFSEHAVQNHVLANTLFNHSNFECNFERKFEDMSNVKTEFEHVEEFDQAMKEEPMVQEDITNHNSGSEIDNTEIPGPKCLVSGCEFQGFEVYPFPNEHTMIVKWLQSLRITKFIPSPDVGVCFKHFHEHDFEPANFETKQPGSLQKILKPTSVPSLLYGNVWKIVEDEKRKWLETKQKKDIHKEQIKNLKCYQKEQIVSIKPNENGWWSCDLCSDQRFYLFFFELMEHCIEFHDFNSDYLKDHYETITMEKQIERDNMLSNDCFICHICDDHSEKFEHKFQLTNHWYKEHSNPEVTYDVCQWCSELFTSSLNSLTHYKKLHEGLNQREFQCEFCTQVQSTSGKSSITFSSFQILDEHCKKNHDKKLPAPFLCQICNETFIIEEGLFHHQKHKHSHEISTYKCDECDWEFFSKGLKVIHDSLYHDLSKSKLYSCKYCPEVAFSIDEIMNHHNTYHELHHLPFFCCEICEFVTPKKPEAINHMKDEHNIDEYRPYKCKQCNASFLDIRNHTRHVVNSHYQQTVNCKECGKELKPGSLLQHMKSVHSNTGQERNFVCHICGYSGRKQMDLTKHSHQLN